MGSKIVSTLKNQAIPLVAINAAGFVEPTLDNWINANVPFLSSNATTNPTMAPYAKYMKMALYSLTGLGVAIAADSLAKGSSAKTTQAVGDGAALFFYGLSGATAAEDPVFNVPSPGYAIAGNPQARYGGPSAVPARQVTSRTGNFIS